MENKETVEIDFLEENLKKRSKIKLSENFKKAIFNNIFIAILIMSLFLILNLASRGLTKENIEKVLHITSGIFLFVGIILMEKAYKNDNTKKAINSIECLTISVYFLSVIHVITKFDFEVEIYLSAFSYIVSIYYVLKSIIEYFKGKKEYLSTLSDVKEIVKKEEPTKKEAKKRKRKKEIKNKEKIKDKEDIKIKKQIEKDIDKKVQTKRRKKEVEKND